MTIKDDITLGLKNAITDSIKKSFESGNEHGFLICKDKDGKLSASAKKCEGKSCDMKIDISPGLCPEKKIQGIFHVHPKIPSLEKNLGRKATDDDIKNIFMTDEKGNIVSLQTPSYGDILKILLTKCNKSTEGTVCVAADADPNKVECWTPRRGAANFATCLYAKREDASAKITCIGPKMWTKSLFKKEIIDLRNIH
jgi:hypothetical protein